MLTDASIRAAKAKSKPYKLWDTGGLHLLITPKGGRWWRFKYRFDGREKGISLGVYPEVPLSLARKRRDDARRDVSSGIDPSAKRQADKSARTETVEAVGLEWLAVQRKKFAASTYAKAEWMLKDHVFVHLGARPLRSVSPQELLNVVQRVSARGKHETAKRIMQRCGQLYRYAVATGRADRDITADIRGALPPVTTTNRAAITDPQRIGELLRAIDSYRGQISTAIALKLAPLLFVRPGELRAAEWAEINLDKAEWRIAAARTKMRAEHLVPLPRQAVDLLREIQAVTGEGRYVFPSLLSSARPMSENTINAALRRLGFASDEMTGHGFRALASTRLNELGFAPDVIELQLAHKERNKVRAAYNRAQRIADRRKLMEDWADYLDELRAGGNVVPLRRAG